MAAVPADLLYKAMVQNDYRFAYKLADKGILMDDSAYEIVRHCAQNPSDWKMARLLRDGAQIGIENYAAMNNAFIKQGRPDAGEILLDRGMDFDAFKQWSAENNIDLSRHDSFEQLDAQWAGTHEQDSGMQMS